MDNLGCIGTESSLAECTHNGWGKHNCDHDDDVSIKCAVPATSEIGRRSCKSYIVDHPVINWSFAIFSPTQMQ